MASSVITNMSQQINSKYDEELLEYLQENCTSSCNHQSNCPHIDQFDAMKAEESI